MNTANIGKKAEQNGAQEEATEPPRTPNDLDEESVEPEAAPAPEVVAAAVEAALEVAQEATTVSGEAEPKKTVEPVAAERGAWAIAMDLIDRLTQFAHSLAAVNPTLAEELWEGLGWLEPDQMESVANSWIEALDFLGQGIDDGEDEEGEGEDEAEDYRGI